MDLMKTLLIYMTATLALAVQNTAAPKVTPAPTAVPAEVIMENGETPAPGADLTAIPPELLNQPNATAEITPAPVPEITPNTRAYHNVGMGAKGKEVRRIQEKLVELGYLPEGAADGAYGRQTYNAVKKFQHYNGLAADGVAGRKTQTYLFENPDIFPNPEAGVKAAVTEAPTEAPETEAPVTEAPVTEAPVTEAPVTEAPPTEAPATEEPAETEAPAEPEVTEAPEEETEAPAEPDETEPPEETEGPGETEGPAVTSEPEEVQEIIENVDLDADIYELITASIALNEGNGPLEFVTTEDGVPVKAHPRLSQNGAKIRVSLDDLCKCVDGWQLTDDGVGTVVLEAAGYTLALYNENNGCSATVDGMEVPMKDDDFDFVTEGHFINSEFLANVLSGEAVWDQEENTLMLRIRDREAVKSED